MKLDIKNLLILILLVFSLFFGYKWYFSTGNSDYKKELKDLNEKNKALQAQRDSINIEIKKLEYDFLKLKEKEFFLVQKIDSMSTEIELVKSRAAKSKKELDKLRGDLSETRKKIEELKENPVNRTGDSLLNSLKNNLK
jgi:chromosome segregation ATPase